MGVAGEGGAGEQRIVGICDLFGDLEVADQGEQGLAMVEAMAIVRDQAGQEEEKVPRSQVAKIPLLSDVVAVGEGVEFGIVVSFLLWVYVDLGEQVEKGDVRLIELSQVGVG